MNIFNRLDKYLSVRKDYGLVLLRLVIGWRLVDGTRDNVFSWERMIEFRDFLQQHGVQAPLLAAQVSVYAQFICGVLYILGAYTRLAAIIMIINFITALLIVHTDDTFQGAFPALVILAGSVLFLFQGAGKISIDNWRIGKN